MAQPTTGITLSLRRTTSLRDANANVEASYAQRLLEKGIASFFGYYFITLAEFGNKLTCKLTHPKLNLTM
ncbi:MAG: hypothetical protein ACYT04_000000101960, partial [Nostoc sp.]